MKRPLALWQTLLVLLLSTAFLPACSSVKTLWGKLGTSPSTTEIEFSHAEPKTPVQPISKPLSSQWSPTTWVQANRQTPAEPLPRTDPAQSTAAPALIVYFDNDQDHLIPSELERLRNFAQGLKADQTARLEATGHTDSNQTAEYNIDLSKRRAETVRRWLTQFGVPENKVVLGWHGLYQPVSTNLTEEGRALNRRVEIKWISK